MERKDQLIITPRTKVLDLINTYPELEEVLVAYAPAFSKLKNPVLRATIARIATLQQAAAVGNVKVETLVNRLRKEIGQDAILDDAVISYNSDKPGWFAEDQILQVLDAREMLAADEHPVHQVMADLKKLPEGQIYKLVAPFLPAPLIDKAISLGFLHWVDKKSADEFNIYFKK